MNYFLIITALFTSLVSFGQDYYSISTENGPTSWRYPKNVEIELTDASGTRLIELNEISESIAGNFLLNIKVPWKNDVETINEDRDKIIIQRVDHSNETVSVDPRPTIIPEEIKRSITRSVLDQTKYNLEITFSNELFFSFKDGKAKAMQFGEFINIDGAYLIRYDDGLLKVSFDPRTGEVWYVFEK